MGCPISSRKRAILWSVSRWLAEVTRSMQLSPPVSFSTNCSIGAERYRAGTENLVPYMPAERGNERPVIWEVRAAGTRPERRFTEGQLILQAQADHRRRVGPALPCGKLQDSENCQTVAGLSGVPIAGSVLQLHAQLLLQPCVRGVRRDIRTGNEFCRRKAGRH